MHGALKGISASGAAPEARPEPKVPIRSSVKPDYIVCLEDGKKQKMLKRHLMTNHNMTPDEYRQKWGLSPDYPMVAPNYAEQRRTLAKSIGLGTKRRKTRGGKARQVLRHCPKPSSPAISWLQDAFDAPRAGRRNGIS